MPSAAELILMPSEKAIALLERFEYPPYDAVAIDDPVAWEAALAAHSPEEYDDPTDLPEPTILEPGVHKISLLRERAEAATSLYHPDDPAWLPPHLGRECWHIRNGSTAVGEVEVYDWEVEEEEEASAEAYDAHPRTLRYPDGRELVIDLRPYRTLNRKGDEHAA